MMASHDAFGPFDPARFEDERTNTDKRFDQVVTHLSRLEGKIDAINDYVRTHSHPRYVQWAALVPLLAAIGGFVGVLVT